MRWCFEISPKTVPDNSYAAKMVPEGGFEPPTRGFSIRCSTPELLGLHGENRMGAQAIETRDVPWQAQNQSSWSWSRLSL